MDTMINILLVGLLILNNIVWMIFFFLFTPDKKKQTIRIPNVRVKMPEIFKKKEEISKDMEDIASQNVTANEVLESMIHKNK